MITYKFLSMDEFNTFSNNPMTEQTLLNANLILESYIGDITEQSTTGEMVKLGRFKHPKLKHVHNMVPLISVDRVISVTRTPFGVTKEEIDKESIYVDELGYIKFFGHPSLAMMIYGSRPTELIIDYTWGYKEIPMELKFACAAIAQNISKRGTYGLKSLTDFDVKLAFVDDSIITNDLRMVINKYKDI